MNVLITDISSYKAIVISKFLKKNYSNLILYSCDHRKFTKYIHTNTINNHFIINKNSYIPDLKSIVLKNQIDIILPINSSEIELLLKHRKEFGNALNYYDTIEKYIMINDKKNIYPLSKKLNFKSPESFESFDIKNIPMVLKPRISSSSKGVYYIKNITDFHKALHIINFSKYEIQKYIPGYGVGYSGFSVDGVIKRSYSHKRIAEYPIEGGSSVYRDEFISNDLDEISKKIISGIKWSGFFMLEYKVSDNNEIYLIEINPRIWGSINQGLSNGCNFFSELFGEIDINIYKKTKTFLSPLVYFTLLTYILRFNFKPLIYFLKNFKSNVSDINIIKDFRGYLSIILRTL